MDMKFLSLDPLKNKHYETAVQVEVNGRPFRISITGSGSLPSPREMSENGYDPEWGMDHTESVEHWFLAKFIIGRVIKG